MKHQFWVQRELVDEIEDVQPLLFAGILIEGGVVGYDSNIMTGGRGARTLGIGYSKQYRQDAVTVSMRAVSVLTGEVLLNVQTRKTILSYGEGGDIFRFIEQGTQLVEYEDGVGNKWFVFTDPFLDDFDGFGDQHFESRSKNELFIGR